VGDLAIDCQLVVKEAKGDVILELVKGGRQFRCKIELATGKTTLSIDNLPEFAPQANTSLHGPGTYDVSFSNIDEQLLLWVDGHAVAFDTATSYPYLGNVKPVETPPVRGSDRPQDATDLSPVGIAVEGGAAVDVRHLKIWRDIYYTADIRTPGMGRFVASQDQSRPIDLHENEFFMMGDNSPASSDSRFWGIEHKVDRRLLIGKALFIYWPHSWAPSWAATLRMFGVELKLPFWPNFKRMTFVH
jgi:signal peptidase I